MSWNFDKSHSKVGFAVRHMMISKVRGEFKNYETELDLRVDDLENSTIKAKIDAASIDTNAEDRDQHLRSEDFFDVEKYPTIDFESTSIKRDDSGNVELTGNLTIRDVTKEITLTGEQLGPAKSPWGTTSVGFSLTGELDREDFGLAWNQALETGGVLVGKKVEITIEAEVVEPQEEEEEEAATV